MEERRTINVHQFTIIVIFFGVGSSILIVPSILAGMVKQDAWISSILGVLAGLIPIAVYMDLARRYPQETIVTINERVLGKWVGKGVSILYIMYFLLLSVFLTGDIGYFLTTEIMPETPIDFIMACLMVVIIYAARLGVDVIAKGAEIFFPWILLLYVLLLLLIMPQIEITKIQPVLEAGVLPVMKAAFPFFSLQEYIVLLMLFSAVKVSPKGPKAFYIGSLVAGGMIVTIILMCLLVLGPNLTAENIYASYALAKKISIGNFIERVEIIAGGLWFITITFKLLLTFYAAAMGMSQLFRTKSFTSLTIPLGMLTVAAVLVIYTDIVYVQDFIIRIWPSFSLAFILLLPLLTWLVALFKR